MREKLYDALIHAKLDQAAILLEQGANINETNKWGDSLLDELIRLIYDEDERRHVVKFMLNRGADPLIRNNEAFGPLGSAILAQDTEVLRLLLDHGADPNIECDDGMHELLYDYAEFDYRYETYDFRLPEEPAESDKESEEAWLNFLDRIARKYDKRRPDYLMLLRQRGAKMWIEHKNEENTA
jgi:ankyrin repeat protein